MPASPKRWLREPLLHFLVAGLLLFAVYRILHPELFRTAEVSRIEVTADDLRQLEVVWTAQWHRPPTPEEMHRLVEGRVREEILYREALAPGLDRGDIIANLLCYANTRSCDADAARSTHENRYGVRGVSRRLVRRSSRV